MCRQQPHAQSRPLSNRAQPFQFARQMTSNNSLSQMFSIANLVKSKEARSHVVQIKCDDFQRQRDRLLSERNDETSTCMVSSVDGADTLRGKGLCILNDFTCKSLDEMNKIARKMEYAVCNRLTEIGIPYCVDARTYSQKRKFHFTNNLNNGDASIENTFKFKEVSSRCFGRLDIQINDQYLSTFEEVTRNSKIRTVVHEILGNDAELRYVGLIISFPGSQSQPWHGDGPHLFGPSLQCPAHAVNVFIPLSNITEELGPTEFIPTSHLLENAVCYNKVLQAVDGPTDALSMTLVNKIRENKLAVPIRPLLTAGQVLMYDFRTLHRGTSNTSISSGDNHDDHRANNSDTGKEEEESSKHIDNGNEGDSTVCSGSGRGGHHTQCRGGHHTQCRRMLYLLYTKPWFSDTINFGEHSLFEEDALQHRHETDDKHQTRHMPVGDNDNNTGDIMMKDKLNKNKLLSKKKENKKKKTSKRNLMTGRDAVACCAAYCTLENM